MSNAAAGGKPEPEKPVAVCFVCGGKEDLEEWGPIAFCGNCIGPFNLCSVKGCGNISDSDKKTTMTINGVIIGHGDEHVCCDCSEPFCEVHFHIFPDADRDEVHEKDGVCLECEAKRNLKD
jgi:hypothetical protein